MDLVRQNYLKFSSAELKERITNYNRALPAVSDKAREAMNEYINTMIDILKERNDL